MGASGATKRGRRVAALVAVLAISLLLAVRVMPRREPARTRSARPASAQVVEEAAPAPSALAPFAAQEDGGNSANGATAGDGGDEGGDEGTDGLVEDFYEDTDKWMAVGGKARPTVEDASAFAERFRALPEGRREECLQRALNLVPDENVMVLVGILMDKTQEREYVQLVFNDILNRPDEVKRPILEQVLADGEHPCADDAAWIFEVTGEQARDLPQPTSD